MVDGLVDYAEKVGDTQQYVFLLFICSWDWTRNVTSLRNTFYSNALSIALSVLLDTWMNAKDIFRENEFFSPANIIFVR